MSQKEPFWKTIPMAQMSDAQWESLCDGCGQCCLHKLEDYDNGDYHITDVACSMLDCQTCRCRDYENRWDYVPDCVRLTPKSVLETAWLPETCGYRLIADGRDLPDWHPLVSGDPSTVHKAGISVRDHAVPGDPSVEEMVARIQRRMAAQLPGAKQRASGQ